MMHTGVSLYKKPSINDPYYFNLVNGYLKNMVNTWDLTEFIPKNVYHLLKHIFINENKRYSIHDIIKHEYVRNAIMY